MEENKFVQYGCGIKAPVEWINYDASPTLSVQKMFLLGTIVKKYLNVVFPDNVKYGDIIKGLPEPDNSCAGVYCSHTLEHLSLEDFRKALRNTYKILKPGGVFRCVVPDFEWAARVYIKAYDDGNAGASLDFLNETLLGTHQRKRGIKGILTSVFGNSRHLWMWDKKSLARELGEAGFRDIRTCSFNDAESTMFTQVEEKGRFLNAVAIECRK